MEDYNDNIPDENIKIVSPKKYSFLLNNMNMFINSEKKKGNFEKYMNNQNIIKKKDNIKYKAGNSSEDSDLKTIIKEPGILTSNKLIDIKRLIKSKNERSRKVVFKNNNNNFNKFKKNVKVSLYRNAKKRENVINNNKNANNNNICNSNLNSKSNKLKNRPNKRKINSKNNLIQKDNNYTQTDILKNKDSDIYVHKEISCSNIKLNSKKNILDNNETTSNKKNIFIKKLNKDNKNIAKRNVLSINKEEKQNEKERENKNNNKGIITKKISFKYKIIERKKYIEEKNKLYMSQKDLISNISVKNENINNTDISLNIINNTNTSNICISKSNKNLLENKNKYKGKIYHIDYSNNKKRDLTNIIMGLNIIKEIIYKKLKNNLLKLKINCIYKRKIIYMTPKLKKYNKDLTYKIKDSINHYYSSINYTEYASGSNRKSFRTLPKFNDFCEKNNNNNNKIDNDIREFRKMIEKKAKTNFLNKNKKNRVLFLNPNNYINNCNINSIEINLFKNEYIKDSKENNNNILIKKNYNNLSYDNYLIKPSKTS